MVAKSQYQLSLYKPNYDFIPLSPTHRIAPQFFFETYLFIQMAEPSYHYLLKGKIKKLQF